MPTVVPLLSQQASPPTGLPNAYEEVVACLPGFSPCPFLEQQERASTMPHRVVTSARAAMNLRDLASESEILFLIDDALDVLTPHANTGEVILEDLDRLKQAAEWAAWQARRDGEEAGWWVSLIEVIDSVRSALALGVTTTIPLPTPCKAPRLWQGTLWRTFSEAPQPLPRHLIRVCAAATSGELASLLLHEADARPLRQQGALSGSPADKAPHLPRQQFLWGEAGTLTPPQQRPVLEPACTLSAVWAPRLPEWATIIAIEQVSATNLGRATGKPVTDITLAAPSSWRAGAVQTVHHVTAGTRPGPLADLIRGHLEWFPGGTLAVILPGSTERADKLRQALPALLSEGHRLRLVGWHDEGRLTGDRILALGVPAVPPRTVRRRLAQSGLDSAAIGDKDWGDVAWEGRQVDGSTRTVKTKGYRQPDWGQAYADAVNGLLRRRLAGIKVPIVFATDHDLGLPLVAQPVPLDAQDEELLELLREELEANPCKLAVGVQRLIDLACGGVGKRKGWSKAALRKRLVALAAGGLVSRVGQRGGWGLPGIRSANARFC
jgi:hypothetical protein